MKDLRQPWGQRFVRSRYASWRGDDKLISGSDGSHELFDLSVAEWQDLGPEDPERVARLTRAQQRFLAEAQRSLESLVSEAEAQSEPELSPEELERLKSLGYN